MDNTLDVQTDRQLIMGGYIPMATDERSESRK
jgi:hypothetical protein